MFRNGHSFSLFLGKWLWLERPLNSRQGAGILYGLSAMLFQPEGGKKERKKNQWFFVLISRMLATSCTSRLTHARAHGRGRERERRILPFPFWIYHYTLPTINRYICHFTLSFIDKRNVIKTSGF